VNRSEIALLLSAIAGRDQRTIGDADILAWHEDLGDLDFADARAAVSRHFRDSFDRIMPAHIRRLVRIIRDERRAHETIAALPPGRFEDDPDRNARVTRNIAEVRRLLEDLADKRAVPDAGPTTRSQAIHTRATLRANKERGRPEPKPSRERKAKARPRDNPNPADEQVAWLAKHYLRDGWDADQVADRLGISRQWCRKTGKRLAPLGPVGWCGKCTYDGRMRKESATSEPKPCPDCNPPGGIA
jgi:hypothetical protein